METGTIMGTIMKTGTVMNGNERNIVYIILIFVYTGTTFFFPLFENP